VDIVDRDEHRPAPGERAQRAEQGRGGRARLARRGGIGAQQRDLQRAGLGSGQLWQRLVGNRPEQIGQPGEREPGLGRVADALQYQVAVGPRDLQQRTPDGGLADPGRAFDEQRPCRPRCQERPAGL
jgi:hypothetical protein